MSLKKFFKKHKKLARALYNAADKAEKKQQERIALAAAKKDERTARTAAKKEEKAALAAAKKNERTARTAAKKEAKAARLAAKQNENCEVQQEKKPFNPRLITFTAGGIVACIIIAVITMIPKEPTEVQAADMLYSQREDSSEIMVMGETYGVVYINNLAVASLRTYDEAKAVEGAVVAHYQTQGSEILSYSIAERIEARPVAGAPWSPVSVEEAVSVIVNGTAEPKKYSVVKGDTLYGIASKLNMTYAELLAANPGITPNYLKIGQELNVVEIKPLVHVSISERYVAKEYVPFGTTYESNSSMYIGTTKLKSSGTRGVNNVTYEYKSENGVRTETQKIGTEVVSKPINQVTYKGAKALPLVYGTGVFRNPLDGAITVNSAYGIYRGAVLGTHGGADLAASAGQNIYAADDGVVEQSGYYGTYGNMVLLDHGNGYETLYAHASKLLVSVGDTVKKGDVIALVGTTGRSTGPHLHFEVRVNGVKKNPINYLP